MEAHNLFEVIDAVQSADLKKEEERLAHEKAARLALQAQTRPGTMNMSQLLDKMYGAAPEQMTTVVVPKAAKENTDGNPQAPASNVVTLFPAPPTGKR